MRAKRVEEEEVFTVRNEIEAVDSDVTYGSVGQRKETPSTCLFSVALLLATSHRVHLGCSGSGVRAALEKRLHERHSVFTLARGGGLLLCPDRSGASHCKHDSTLIL